MTSTVYRPTYRDPVIVAGRRPPAFVDQHNWMAQSAIEVLRLCEPLTHSVDTARAVEVVCAKIDIDKNVYMAERVMMSADPNWVYRITSAIGHAHDKLNWAIWGPDSANFDQTYLGTMVAHSVVGYFVPDGADPEPETYRAQLSAPLNLAIGAARICQTEPLVAEFIRELGPTLPVDAQELIDRARQLTAVTP